ncbi:MAG: DUF4296 domain-containing protein [Paludibacteraceae bacterium]|nr:DUF4296 domain-containing protein [Paludibacteraceae bacterium]
MRNRYVLFVVLCACTLGLTGCRPKGILHSSEMREVLVDLHKTDALLQVSGLQYGHNEALDIYYAQVLEKHGITQAQFDSSIVWYTAHPLLFDKIYPKVEADIEAERTAFQTEYAAELNLRPTTGKDETAGKETEQFTLDQLDSIIWVNLHGYPTSWNPWTRPYRLVR